MCLCQMSYEEEIQIYQFISVDVGTDVTFFIQLWDVTAEHGVTHIIPPISWKLSKPSIVLVPSDQIWPELVKKIHFYVF